MRVRLAHALVPEPAREGHDGAFAYGDDRPDGARYEDGGEAVPGEDSLEEARGNEDVDGGREGGSDEEEGQGFEGEAREGRDEYLR